MIDKVTVRNFQSLESTEVELGTLTVLVGPNDLGKSAFFRSVRAAAEAAVGSGFISRGHTTTKVTLAVDGHEVEWEKGAATNRYRLDGVLYDRVGRETPPDVDSLLRLGSVSFDRNLELNLNFADQDDPPFLIPFPGGITSSQVAKVLGDLTNLNVLYRAVGEADTRRRRSESDLKVRKSDKAAIDGQLTAYQELDQEVNVFNNEILEPFELDVVQARKRLGTLHFFREQKEQLRLKHQQIQDHRASILPDLSAELKILEAEVSDLDDLTQLRDELTTIHQGCQEATAARVVAAQEAVTAEQALKDLYEEIGICPICGKELHDSPHGSEPAVV